MGGWGAGTLVSNPFNNIQIIFSYIFQFPFLAPQAPQAPQAPHLFILWSYFIILLYNLFRNGMIEIWGALWGALKKDGELGGASVRIYSDPFLYSHIV